MTIIFLNEATRDEVLMDRNHLRDDADFNRVYIRPSLPRPVNTATSSTTEQPTKRLTMTKPQNVCTAPEARTLSYDTSYVTLNVT